MIARLSSRRPLLACLALALAGLAAGAGLAQGSARHPEVFSVAELRLCSTAATHQSVNGAPADRPRFNAWMRELFPLEPPGEPAITGVYRGQMLQTEVTAPEALALAEACVAAFTTGNRFVNPVATRTSEAALAAYIARREASYAADRAEERAAAAARPPQQAPRSAASATDPKCGAIVEETRVSATRSFRAAQALVDRWIRQGAVGAAYGEYELKSGCRAISNGLSRLAIASCPAPYFTALSDFRAGYYIGFPSGSRYSCG